MDKPLVRLGALLLLMLSAGGVLATILPPPPREIIAAAVRRYSGTSEVAYNKSGQHHVSVSNRHHYTKHIYHKRRRVENRRTVDSTPPPRKYVYRGMTVKVLDAKGAPVPNITMKATIHNRRGEDSQVSKTTNANGNFVLDKIGPLPASIELDATSPRWDMDDDKDADSASFVIKPSSDSKYFATAKVRPAFVTLNIKGGTGEMLSSAARLNDHDTGGDENASPAPPKITQVAVTSDNQAVDVPESDLQDGDVPLVLSKDLPGGKAETVIARYDKDAQSDDIQVAPPRLVSLKSVAINGNISVLSTDDEIESNKVLGKRPGDAKLLRNEKNGMTDGSEWWIYPKAGLAVKERPTQVKNLHLTERIRLLGPQGGNICGIAVGSTLTQLREQLGEPQVANAPPIAADAFAPKAQVDSYLDDGLRFGHDDQKILWIDIARSTELLLKGTTSFVKRERARVFVADFKNQSGFAKLNMNSQASFKNYLGRLPSIELVENRDDADLILSARVTKFEQDKDQLFGSLIPYDYKCTTTLQYDLQDASTGAFVAQNKTLTGTCHVSFRKEIYEAIAAAIGIKVLIGGNIGKYGPWVIVPGVLYDLKRKMKKAANRCPGISERQVFDGLMQDVTRAVDFRAQVTKLDYGAGLITLNLGSDDGVRLSTPDKPFEFELSIGDTPLLEKAEDGRGADYYTAVVKSVSNQNCVCEVRHVKGGFKDEATDLPSQAAPEIVKELPDPTTGVLAARAWTRFAPVEVISDEDIARSDELEAQQRAKYEAQKAAQAQPQNNG